MLTCAISFREQKPAGAGGVEAMQTLFDQLAIAMVILRVFTMMSIGNMHSCRALQCYSNIRRFAGMTTLASRLAAFRRSSAAPLNAGIAARFGGMAPCLQACHGGPPLPHVLPARTHNMLHTRGARWQSTSYQPHGSLGQPHAQDKNDDTPDDDEKTPCVWQNCTSANMQPRTMQGVDMPGGHYVASDGTQQCCTDGAGSSGQRRSGRRPTLRPACCHVGRTPSASCVPSWRTASTLLRPLTLPWRGCRSWWA
jgi:hypothetical protein